MEEVKNNNKASGICVASLVLGIFAIVLAFVPFLGLILGIVALVVTIIAFKKLSKNNEKSGMVIGGLVTTIIGLVISIIMTVVVVGGIIASVNFYNSTTKKVTNTKSVLEKIESEQRKVEKELQSTYKY